MLGTGIREGSSWVALVSSGFDGKTGVAKCVPTFADGRALTAYKRRNRHQARGHTRGRVQSIPGQGGTTESKVPRQDGRRKRGGSNL